MNPKDLFTVVFLAISLVWAIAIYILIKRNHPLPRVFGFGALALAFVGLMTSSILTRPFSALPEYILTNSLLSGLVGISGYISGRIIERRRHEQRRD